MLSKYYRVEEKKSESLEKAEQKVRESPVLSAHSKKTTKKSAIVLCFRRVKKRGGKEGEVGCARHGLVLPTAPIPAKPMV